MDAYLEFHPILKFLRDYGAGRFANAIESDADLLSMLDRYTLVLALDDAGMSELESQYEKSNINNVVRNHLSILPLNKVSFPTYTSIDGFQYGNGVKDLHDLGISVVQKIGSTTVMVIKNSPVTNVEEDVPKVDETTVNYMAKLPYDVFVQMVIANDIKGIDLIALCGVSEAINAKCNNKDQLLFRGLLKRDYGMRLSQNPRRDYVRMLNASLYTCGSNFHGQLGLGDLEIRYVPTKVKGIRGISRVICGERSTAILTNSGQVMMCGLNSYGQLGLGHTSMTKVPTLILNLNNIVQVACGDDHSGFLTKNGQVYMAGANWSGQFGILPTSQVAVPTLIPNLNNIVQISCGDNHSGFLTSTGQVLMTGSNFRGQLGIHDLDHASVPTLVPGLEGISQIICGAVDTMFLSKDGRVYACGRNEFGQLGLGDRVNRNVPTLIPNMEGIIHVSHSGSADMPNHTAFLKNDGTVLICGYNGRGQLGLGDTDLRNIPTLIPNLNNIVQVACGFFSYTLFLTNQGRVYVCGDDSHGQLGLGQLGLGEYRDAIKSPIMIPSLEGVIQICAGSHSAFLVA